MRSKQYHFCVENPKQEATVFFYDYFIIEQVAARIVDMVLFGDQNNIKIILTDIESGKIYEVKGVKSVYVEYHMESCSQINEKI